MKGGSAFFFQKREEGPLNNLIIFLQRERTISINFISLHDLIHNICGSTNDDSRVQWHQNLFKYLKNYFLTIKKSKRPYNPENKMCFLKKKNDTHQNIIIWSNQGRTIKLTLSVKTAFSIFNFFEAEHLWTKKTVKSELLQTIQTITTSNNRSLSFKFTKKIRTSIKKTSEFSNNWIVDKTEFKNFFSEFWTKTEKYRQLNQFHNFASKNEKITTSLDSSVIFEIQKNRNSEFFFSSFFRKSTAKSKKINENFSRVSFETITKEIKNFLIIFFIKKKFLNSSKKKKITHRHN